jgi:hypothetical protein
LQNLEHLVVVLDDMFIEQALGYGTTNLGLDFQSAKVHLADEVRDIVQIKPRDMNGQPVCQEGHHLDRIISTRILLDQLEQLVLEFGVFGYSVPI